MLRPIIQQYADTTVRDTVVAVLDEILQDSQALLNSFSTRPGVDFTVSNPRRHRAFDRDFMQSEGENDEREVAIMVFPGLLKVGGSRRVCMFRARVICRDEAEI